MKLPFVLSILVAGAGMTAAAACSSSSANANDGPPSAVPEAAVDSTTVPARSTCTVEHDYATACGTADKLTCGEAAFDAWCAGDDTTINSDEYRLGEALCLTAANCDGAARQDCQYSSYASRTPTAAQKSLVVAYCAQCEPSDTAGCATRAIAYDSTAGATDLFIAAWELSDALVDEIRTQCTGVADSGLGDGGADACAKAFGDCSGGIYVDHLPDCP